MAACGLCACDEQGMRDATIEARIAQQIACLLLGECHGSSALLLGVGAQYLKERAVGAQVGDTVLQGGLQLVT